MITANSRAGNILKLAASKIRSVSVIIARNYYFLPLVSTCRLLESMDLIQLLSAFSISRRS